MKAINEQSLDSPEEVSWDQLREKVRVYSNALKASSLRRGDVMCMIGGSTITSLALYLAAASIGVIIASFATDAGERVLLDRVGQLRPKLLFAEPSYHYSGKQHDIAGRVQRIWNSVEKPDGSELISTGKEAPSGWTLLDDFLQRGTDGPLEFEQLPFHTHS